MFPLKECVGEVVEVLTKYKAIVEFENEGKKERALLWYDKLKVNGEPLPEGGCIINYVQIHKNLKFLCHNFDDSGVDRCGWYITSAWSLDESGEDLRSTDTILRGMYNCVGVVQEVARRQGVLSYSNNGQEENVLFLASKLWCDGKRVKTKAVLSSLAWLEEGRQLMFDAVPCDPQDSNGKCSWFATVAWKGRKPLMDYEDTRGTRQKQGNSMPQLEDIKMVTSNPHSLFLRTEGQILKILSPEFGLALARVKNNRWESVLFHRNQATIFSKCLATKDLTKFFQEGDKLRLVAASAPKKFGTRWVASQVRMYVDPSIAHKYQF